MKTFKMLSFDFANESKHQIPLIDGIIINQENPDQSWILELFISKEYQEIFEKLKSTDETFDIQVIISFPENEPAPFRVKVSTISKIGDHISVLLEGKVKTKRTKYAEQLLRSLIEEGLSKEDLFNRFEQGMRERPKLKEN